MDKKTFEKKVFEVSRFSEMIESVDYELSFRKTDHFEERKNRHSSKITDDEVEATFNFIRERLVSKILDGQYQEGTEVVVRDHVYNLNIVSKIENVYTNSVDILLLTVMLESNFEPSSGQEVVDIYKK